MSATIVREKRQTTLPPEVCEPAGIGPGDQIDWRFEAGEIRGRKMAPAGLRRVIGRLVKRGGELMFEFPGIPIEPESFGEAAARAVQEERESR